MKSAVTISLVEEARGGPFVFWHDLEDSIRTAAEMGFDAVEIFATSPLDIDVKQVRQLLDDAGLEVAAVGTGAGWVVHQVHLVDAHPVTRDNAIEFICSMINMGAEFGAPAIIGSMQGRWQDDIDKETAYEHLREGLNVLGNHAAEKGVPLIYEPLNRYETNMCNTMAEGVQLIDSLDTDNVKLLADLFHMNIEETSIAQGIRDGGSHIGHVHFVDTNRRPAGCGHMEYSPIIAALREIGYEGYLSAEAFPWPDSNAAAKQTIDEYRSVTA
ncbi:MAG: sugar phosphate isomerase/epimerase [Planctomycetaceae bacterium]|nr:sugar phosphate isomerase/epimerase [Planctomycetaceae bacterium]